MEQEFEAQAYDAVCRAMGEAVWQLVAGGEPVRPDYIASKILALSDRRDDLAASIALSVLSQA
ncbi:hypothetical protein Pvag_0964 [Pantoea vagans C9-1]|uniref:DUF2767 family protein n=1 Tax=Pantoea vagans TaxID=470934 RepID=UPI0001E59EA0|nr:DUF2767 family protein [Pantoea vagans]ADO09157.1 hypothetical protein Pvag_0964 [Pantoea vagans C9-1]